MLADFFRPFFLLLILSSSLGLKRRCVRKKAVGAGAFGGPDESVEGRGGA